MLDSEQPPRRPVLASQPTCRDAAAQAPPPAAACALAAGSCRIRLWPGCTTPERCHLQAREEGRTSARWPVVGGVGVRAPGCGAQCLQAVALGGSLSHPPPPSPNNLQAPGKKKWRSPKGLPASCGAARMAPCPGPPASTSMWVHTLTMGCSSRRAYLQALAAGSCKRCWVSRHAAHQRCRRRTACRQGCHVLAAAGLTAVR